MRNDGEEIDVVFDADEEHDVRDESVDEDCVSARKYSKKSHLVENEVSIAALPTGNHDRKDLSKAWRQPHKVPPFNDIYCDDEDEGQVTGRTVETAAPNLFLPKPPPLLTRSNSIRDEFESEHPTSTVSFSLGSINDNFSTSVVRGQPSQGNDEDTDVEDENVGSWNSTSLQRQREHTNSRVTARKTRLHRSQSGPPAFAGRCESPPPSRPLPPGMCEEPAFDDVFHFPQSLSQPDPLEHQARGLNNNKLFTSPNPASKDKQSGVEFCTPTSEFRKDNFGKDYKYLWTQGAPASAIAILKSRLIGASSGFISSSSSSSSSSSPQRHG
jgi:hypothetical protein